MNNTPQMDPERQKQVNEWLNKLHGAAQQSYDTCRHLRERLNPLMRREPAEATDATKIEVPEVELVDVAQAICEVVKVLNATSEIHRDTLRLLEV